MDDNRVYTLLRRLLRREEDSRLGGVHYYAGSMFFYDAYRETDGVSEEAYEKELKELNGKKFLDINLNGGPEYEMAIIHVTTDGVAWVDSWIESNGLGV